MICSQTRLPGVSVSQVARRYDVNANQVFNWLKNPMFAASSEDSEVAQFLPVEVVDLVEPERPAAPDCSEMQIDLAGGQRLQIRGSYDPDALAALIRKLSA